LLFRDGASPDSGALMAIALSRWLNEEDRPLRRRAVSLAVTIIVHLLLLFLLLRLAPPEFLPMGRVGSLMTFSVMPAAEPEKSAQKAAAKPAAAQTKVDKAITPPKQALPPPIVKMPTPLKMPDGFIELSRSDVSKVDQAMNTPHESQSTGQATAAAGGGGDGDTPSSMGPKGDLLYAAEWYRRPTDAELGTYMPHRQLPEGAWGEIACRTVARFHVEDCYELGDSFPGTGIARGMRQAAFQFLVRPPRVGGRLLVGTWVRIRITLTEHPNNGDGQG
jgi:protein TonB